MEPARPLQGLRILIPFPHMVTPGGALVYTLRLAEQFLLQGAKVAILVLRVDRDAIYIPPGIEILSIQGPLSSSLRYWLLFPFWQAKINGAIAAWGPDVLVPQVFPANWWGWFYKRQHPEMKLVWICHEPSAFIHSPAWISALRPRWKSYLARLLKPFLAAIDTSLARYCDRIVANSPFTAMEVKRVYGVAADGIACPGIDLPAIPDGYERKWEILSVARLTRFKRIDFLLDVFRQLLERHPDLTYHIVGTGEEEVHLRRQAQGLGLEGQVIFHGKLEDRALSELYSRSTLFLHGSIDEPFGIAPLEAMAHGTPVVAHCSGGPKDFVDDRCGRLIDSLDSLEWASEIHNYLATLAANSLTPESVRECARRFDWRHSLAPALQIIDDLAHSPCSTNQAVMAAESFH